MSKTFILFLVMKVGSLPFLQMNRFDEGDSRKVTHPFRLCLYFPIACGVSPPRVSSLDECVCMSCCVVVFGSGPS